MRLRDQIHHAIAELRDLLFQFAAMEDANARAQVRLARIASHMRAPEVREHLFQENSKVLPFRFHECYGVRICTLFSFFWRDFRGDFGFFWVVMWWSFCDGVWIVSVQRGLCFWIVKLKD